MNIIRDDNKRKFDYNLFGVVYPKLGWCDDSDEFYREWKFSLTKNV